VVVQVGYELILQGVTHTQSSDWKRVNIISIIITIIIIIIIVIVIIIVIIIIIIIFVNMIVIVIIIIVIVVIVITHMSSTAWASWQNIPHGLHADPTHCVWGAGWQLERGWRHTLVPAGAKRPSQSGFCECSIIRHDRLCVVEQPVLHKGLVNDVKQHI
jgi:hypothetical protein